MKVLLASFEPRRDRTLAGERFVRKPTRHTSSRQFESQPTKTRGRYEHTLNAQPYRTIRQLCAGLRSSRREREPGGMIHIRAVSPPDTTPRLVASLERNSGVLNLIVLQGVVRNPDGDAVQFDVINAQANEVVLELRTLGVDRIGSIVIEDVGTELSDRVTWVPWSSAPSTRPSSASRSGSTRTIADGSAPARGPSSSAFSSQSLRRSSLA